MNTSNTCLKNFVQQQIKYEWKYRKFFALQKTIILLSCFFLARMTILRIDFFIFIVLLFVFFILFFLAFTLFYYLPLILLWLFPSFHRIHTLIASTINPSVIFETINTEYEGRSSLVAESKNAFILPSYIIGSNFYCSTKEVNYIFVSGSHIYNPQKQKVFFPVSLLTREQEIFFLYCDSLEEARDLEETLQDFFGAKITSLSALEINF